MLGLSCALVGASLAVVTGESRFDAVGSVAIGLLLAVTPVCPFRPRRWRGALLIVPQARHTLEALEDAAVLLTVAKLPWPSGHSGRPVGTSVGGGGLQPSRRVLTHA